MTQSGMRLLTVTNLYPRPDQPNRGLFNAHQFLALATAGCSVSRTENRPRISSFRNLCIVPEWRLWLWPRIRAWSDPFTRLLGTRYVPAFYIPVVGRNASWITYTHALGQIEDLVRECDTLLATWLYPDAVAAATLARRNGKKLWIKVHGTDRFHLRNSGRRTRVMRAVATAQGIVCNCRFMVEELATRGLPREKLRVVPNGVDTNRFRYRAREAAARELAQTARTDSGRAVESLPSRLGELAQRKIILFVGNLVRVKGPDVFLTATGRLKEHGVEIVLIGNGPLRKRLEELARGTGNSSRVHFLGERPQSEVALWMNVADVLAVTSRSEGLPNVLLEALAAGLPVVTTDVGGCREAVAEEPYCRVVPPENPVALARALQEVLAASPDRTALAERHANKWSWAASAEALLSVLQAD